ncbi:MAG: hypothetical protein Q7T88_05045 [Methylotenera sp.]|nr:hypothetical protein [Methylotenera sp.]
MDRLTETEISTLNEALNDEYLAWATYNQVIADFGEVVPFSNIRESEARHIQALCALFVRYGLSIPDNPWLDKVEHYANLKAACEAGVAAEMANHGMYNRLLETTQREDILTVLRHLQNASQQRHLVEFQRCVQGIAPCSAGHRARHHGHPKGNI